MLNLLPEYQKRKVLAEYRVRVAVVLIMLLAGAAVIFAVFLMPSYAYLHAAKSDLAAKKQAFDEVIQSKTASTSDKTAGDAVKAIAALQPLGGSLEPLLYIDALAPASAGISSGVRVNGYFLTPASNDKIGVMISGIADSREGLTKYSAYLDGRFGGVKLPLSSLAKQSDIQFDFKFEADRKAFVQANSAGADSSQPVQPAQ